MNPQDQQQQQNAADLEAQADRLQAALIAPLPDSTPQEQSSFLIPSERESFQSLLATLVQRVDQLGKASQEQMQRQEQVIAEMLETMKLAQIMIAQQDRQQADLSDKMERLEMITSALLKVQSNLSEIVAALLGPDC